MFLETMLRDPEVASAKSIAGLGFICGVLGDRLA